MLSLIGRLLGQLFLTVCKLSHISFLPLHSKDTQIRYLQSEIKKLKTANSVMKQFIRRNRLKPSFTSRCRMVLFTFRFHVPLRQIHHYLPITSSTIQRYISKVGKNLFDLRSKTSKPFSSPHKTRPDIVSLVWRIKDDNPDWGYLRITIHLWHLKVFMSPSTVRSGD